MRDNMNMNEIISYITSGASWVFASVTNNEVLQIIAFILSALGTVTTMILSVLGYLHKRKNGTATKDDLDDLIDDLKDGADALTQLGNKGTADKEEIKDNETSGKNDNLNQ